MPKLLRQGECEGNFFYASFVMSNTFVEKTEIEDRKRNRVILSISQKNTLKPFTLPKIND